MSTHINLTDSRARGQIIYVTEDLAAINNHGTTDMKWVTKWVDLIHGYFGLHRQLKGKVNARGRQELRYVVKIAKGKIGAKEIKFLAHGKRNVNSRRR